jgi:hypothetical protein
MKTKYKKLAMATATILIGSLAYVTGAYATRPVATDDPADAPKGNASETKVAVCHVPPGNAANMHTINVGFSAWAGGHQQHHGTLNGVEVYDKLGSCETVSGPSGDLVVINGCSGSARTNLIAASRSYFDPVVLPDTLTEDKFLLAAKCADSDLGQGADMVVNDGATHIIQGCKNAGGENNFRFALRTAVSSDATTALAVSDSSMDNQAVREAYRGCVSETDSAAGINVKKNQGDSGHKYRIVSGCNASGLTTLKSAVTSYRSAASSKPVILNTRSLSDAAVVAAMNTCLTSGATRKDVPANSTGGTESHTGYSGQLNQLEKNAR